MRLVKEYERDGRVLAIYIEECPENPREMYDSQGTIVADHPRYDLGDVRSADIPKGSIVLPVYLMDHSGLSISTKPFGCPWDSGQVGVIYCPPENFEGMNAEQIKKNLRYEIELYNQYLTGDVYGAELAHFDICPHCGGTEKVVDDSCSCFYGLDENHIAEMLGIGDFEEWEEVER